MTFVAIVLTGCGTSSGAARAAWQDVTHSGRGQPQLQADEAECEALRQETLANKQAMFRNPHEAYFSCMRARGWRQVEEPQAGSEYCAAQSVRVGDQFTGTDGRHVTVQRIVGLSKRCGAEYPVLIQAAFEP